MDSILCGVVTEKQGELEKFCTYEAQYAMPIIDDDDVEVTDVVCLCQMHSDRFDDGHSMVVKTRKGSMLLIQLNMDSQQDILEEKEKGETTNDA